MKQTRQIDFWQGDFGKEYNVRNSFSADEMDEAYKQRCGVTRRQMNSDFLDTINRDIRILEVGCNIGQQLRHLQLMGFENLYGIEIQHDAVERAKLCSRNINILQGSAFDIPFKEAFFGLVFTSGVLIHIAPQDIIEVLNEIVRCTSRYVWGLEYYSDNLGEVDYRGQRGFLWKQDFSGLYLKSFDGLKLVKEKRYECSDGTDQMFLLERIR